MEAVAGASLLLTGLVLFLGLALLLAPIKLWSIHSELKAIHKLLDAELQRAQRVRNLQEVAR